MGDLYDFFGWNLVKKNWTEINRQDLNRSNLVILRSLGLDHFFWGGDEVSTSQWSFVMAYESISMTWPKSTEVPRTIPPTDLANRWPWRFFTSQMMVQFRRKGGYGKDMAKATDWIAAGAVHLQKKIGKKKLRETTISRKQRLKYRSVVSCQTNWFGNLDLGNCKLF